MPGLQIRKSPAGRIAPSASHTNAAAATERPPSPAVALDAAIDDVAITRTTTQTPARRTMPWHQAATEAAHAYDQGGRHGLGIYLRQNPEAVRALGRIPTPQIAYAVEAALPGDLSALAGIDGGAVVTEVEQRVETQVRNLMRRNAQALVGRATRQLTDLQAEFMGDFDASMAAPLDSAMGQARKELGLPADATRAEAEARFDEAREGLDALGNHFNGATWAPGDFPATRDRASRVLGGQGAAANSPMANALEQESGEDAARAHAVGMAGEAVETVAHLAHAGHATGSALAGTLALSVGIFAAGLYLGHAIHHEVEVEHAAFVQAGQAIGI